MGSYASEPKVDKESLDEYNDRLNCGASSMQGWRVSQEDAHNCLLNFDTNTSFFAVYDGHGGREVAQYCSQKLPDYIKNIEAYTKGNIEEALIEGFLGFDNDITKPEVIVALKEIAGIPLDNNSEDEENVDNLYEEASMPIEKVIEKYTSNILNPALKNLRKGEKAPQSPFLKAKKENGSSEDAGTSKIEPESSTSGSASSSKITEDAVSSSTDEKKTEENEVKTNNVEHDIPEIKITTDEGKEVTNVEKSDKPQVETTSETKEKESPKSEANQNGCLTPPVEIQENGEASPKGKGKAKMKRITPVAVRVSPRSKESPNQLYKKLLDFGGEEEESEDEEDVTFDGAQVHSSDDDEENVSNSHLEAESDESSEEEEDDDDEEEDEEDESLDERDMEFSNNMKDEPGSDSGCTAVVALLKDQKLWVANAGDSRCVVCRNGEAIEMSFDHKPEDQPERERINKAGGRVTIDGRVNNGLNLSRAIGDHAYKQNTELGPREQMITALPDVKTLDITQEDEFMILACDGIWNFMSSQQVVDFIREKMKENREKLSSICEELFDHCLAPDTMGDGTGCDNMTAIIIQFKNNKKRQASPEKLEVDSNKRMKTDSKPQNTV